MLFCCDRMMPRGCKAQGPGMEHRCSPIGGAWARGGVKQSNTNQYKTIQSKNLAKNRLRAGVRGWDGGVGYDMEGAIGTRIDEMGKTEHFSTCLERTQGIQPSLRDSIHAAPRPGVETPGYYQVSRWDGKVSLPTGRGGTCCNPFRVEDLLETSPRVARLRYASAGNPGLDDGTPLGFSKARVTGANNNSGDWMFRRGGELKLLNNFLSGYIRAYPGISGRKLIFVEPDGAELRLGTTKQDVAMWRGRAYGCSGWRVAAQPMGMDCLLKHQNAPKRTKTYQKEILEKGAGSRKLRLEPVNYLKRVRNCQYFNDFSRLIQANRGNSSAECGVRSAECRQAAGDEQQSNEVTKVCWGKGQAGRTRQKLPFIRVNPGKSGYREFFIYDIRYTIYELPGGWDAFARADNRRIKEEPSYARKRCRASLATAVHDVPGARSGLDEISRSFCRGALR
jgi:hypothetical protein